MNKNQLMGSVITGVFMLSAFVACRHEIAGDPCQKSSFQLTVNKTDAIGNQNNGSIVATATGGSDIKYSLNGLPFQVNGNFAGLQPFMTYNVVAKNSWGCTDTASVSINVFNPCDGIAVTINATKTDASPNTNNGTITAIASGGSGFSYSIDGINYQASGTFSNLAAGNYTVTAKNSNGCTGTTTLTVGTNDPCAGVTVVVTATKVDPTTGQSNGTITASATGGTGFTFSLNSGVYQTSGTFNGLAAGTYSVTAKSAAGCLGSSQITLTATNPCSTTNITITTVIVNNSACVTPASGKITVTATGSSGFTYNLNGGAYQASNIFAALSAGNYTVGVKDLNGCTKTATATITNTQSGPLFTQMRTLISTRCNGSGCHMNGGSAAGYNFDPDCNIVTYWNQINRSCVLYTMVKMPKSPQALLTAAEKQKITDWINAGHRYTD